MAKKYTYIYTREQRAYIEVTADSEDAAETLAQAVIDSWPPNVGEMWDESDDDGILELDTYEDVEDTNTQLEQENGS